MAEGGVRELAARWRDLQSPEWRENLVSGIGQAFHEWVDEGAIELLIAALEDPNDNVARRAVKALTNCLLERTTKERKEFAKTRRGKAMLEVWTQAAAWMTPVRRARVAKAVTELADVPREDATRWDYRARGDLSRGRVVCRAPHRIDGDQMVKDFAAASAPIVIIKDCTRG